jgi:hypothetical protein
MSSLLLVAHGSRREASNDELRSLCPGSLLSAPRVN